VDGRRRQQCDEVLSQRTGVRFVEGALDRSLDVAGSSLAVEAGAAILVQRWLLLGVHIDEELVTAVVDDVMLPLLRGPVEHDLTEEPTPGTPPSER
jgi:hypothetical protein